VVAGVLAVATSGLVVGTAVGGPTPASPAIALYSKIVDSYAVVRLALPDDAAPPPGEEPPAPAPVPTSVSTPAAYGVARIVDLVALAAVAVFMVVALGLPTARRRGWIPARRKGRDTSSPPE
jgi:hypothetical protein